MCLRRSLRSWLSSRCGLKLLVYEALTLVYVPPKEPAFVAELEVRKLLVYEALSY
jgi:hypothetical protein